MPSSRITFSFDGNNIVVHQQDLKVRTSEDEDADTVLYLADDPNRSSKVNYDSKYSANSVSSVSMTGYNKYSGLEMFNILKQILYQSVDTSLEKTFDAYSDIEFSDLDTSAENVYDYQITFSDYWKNSINLIQFRAVLTEISGVTVDDDLTIDNNGVVHMKISWENLTQESYDEIRDAISKIDGSEYFPSDYNFGGSSDDSGSGSSDSGGSSSSSTSSSTMSTMDHSMHTMSTSSVAPVAKVTTMDATSSGSATVEEDSSDSTTEDTTDYTAWYPFKLGQNIEDQIKKFANAHWFYINIYGNVLQEDRDIFENFMMDLANKGYIITYDISDIDDEYFMWQANISWNTDSHIWVLNAIPKTNESEIYDINYFYECTKDMLSTGNVGYNNALSIMNSYANKIIDAKTAKYLALKLYDVEQELPEDLMKIVVDLNAAIDAAADKGQYDVDVYNINCSDAEGKAIASYYAKVGYTVGITYYDSNHSAFQISWSDYDDKTK